MPDGQYDRDPLAWAEQQAILLRRLAAGERVNEAVDWSHIIEEIQDVGRSELRACRSALRVALLHLLKLHAWPRSLSARKWRAEVVAFLDQARDDFSPSMRQLIDVQRLYDVARQKCEAEDDDSGLPLPLPAACPFSLDELLALSKTPDLLAHAVA